MNLYYTLTCVVLPATMMAACSASGSKKPIESTAVADKAAIVKQLDKLILAKPITPLTEKIEKSSAAIIEDQHIENQHAELFPLTQTATTNSITKPIKLIYQFGFNKHEMGGAEKRSLEEHADYLIAHPELMLSINGHSDTQGNQVYNQFLSTERAKKVSTFLVEYGVAETQIKINGLGDSEPLNDVNSFKENRRVELQYNDSRVAIK